MSCGHRVLCSTVRPAAFLGPTALRRLIPDVTQFVPPKLVAWDPVHQETAPHTFKERSDGYDERHDQTHYRKGLWLYRDSRRSGVLLPSVGVRPHAFR